MNVNKSVVISSVYRTADDVVWALTSNAGALVFRDIQKYDDHKISGSTNDFVLNASYSVKALGLKKTVYLKMSTSIRPTRAVIDFVADIPRLFKVSGQWIIAPCVSNNPFSSKVAISLHQRAHYFGLIPSCIVRRVMTNRVNRVFQDLETFMS